MPDSPVSKENRISADSHTAEPLDLWQTRMPGKFKEHALCFTGHKMGEGEYAREGGWEPAPRLKDMAADGVAAEVLYPTRAKEMWRHGCIPEVAEMSAGTTRSVHDPMDEAASAHASRFGRLWPPLPYPASALVRNPLYAL